MNVSQINIDKINYEVLPKFIRIKHDFEDLTFKCENNYIPFGVEKNFNNLIIKVLKNKDSETLFEKISQIENNHINFLKKQLNKDKIKFNSQIIFKNNYGTFLILKIPIKNNQFLVDIFDSNNDRKTIFDLDKKITINLILFIDNLWYFKDTYSSLIKIKEISIL